MTHKSVNAIGEWEGALSPRSKCRRFALVLALSALLSGIAWCLRPTERDRESNLKERAAFTGSDDFYFQRLAFSPDGKLLAAGKQDGAIYLWEVANGHEWFIIPGQKINRFDTSAFVGALAFSHDGKTLAWGGGDEKVTLFDLNTKKITATLQNHGNWVQAIAFHKDDNFLASGTIGYPKGSAVVRFWDLSTKKPTIVFDQNKSKFSIGEAGNAIDSLAFDPSGSTLAIGCTRHVLFWDVAKGMVRISISPPAKEQGHGTMSLVYSADGKWLAGAGDRVKIWDSTTGKELQTELNYISRTIAFCPKGKKLAVGINNGTARASFVKIWDLDRKQEIASFEVSMKEGLAQLAWSPDGNTIATCARRAVKLWDVATILKQAKNE